MKSETSRDAEIETRQTESPSAVQMSRKWKYGEKVKRKVKAKTKQMKKRKKVLKEKKRGESQRKSKGL